MKDAFRPIKPSPRPCRCFACQKPAPVGFHFCRVCRVRWQTFKGLRPSEQKLLDDDLGKEPQA
jgi:hypothetical protein